MKSHIGLIWPVSGFVTVVSTVATEGTAQRMEGSVPCRKWVFTGELWAVTHW